MIVVIAHGTMLDELVEIVLPVAVFIGLYLWSVRKEHRKKKETVKHDVPDQPPGP